MSTRRKPSELDVSDRGRQIAVVGGSEASPDVLERAERVGAVVAEAGAILVCGGLEGVMEAASRGAHRAGGVVLGILPGESRSAANPFVTVAVATGLGHFRNYLVVSTADAVIALEGKHGTLSEIAMALTLGKPVIALGPWSVEGVQSAATPEEAVKLAMTLV